MSSVTLILMSSVFVVIFIKALKNCTSSILKLSIISLHLLISYSFLRQLWIYSYRVSLSGDIEQNPGLKRDIIQCFSVCHWNLTSVASHIFSKIQSLIVYNCIHKFDIICLSESYLNSETVSSDSNLQIPGYNFARMDHPSNTKCGGVCLYYKCSLRLKVIDVPYLQECINSEVKIRDKTCNFISLYRSPSQTKDEFENFIKNLELNLVHIANKSPFLIVVLEDFNARKRGWYQNNITTFEGCKIDIASAQFRLSQIIKEPTHILSNSASCNDLIFTSQPNLVMHCGIHP